MLEAYGAETRQRKPPLQKIVSAGWRKARMWQGSASGKISKRFSWMRAGTRDDIRHATEMATLCDGREDLFDAIVKEGLKLHHLREKSDRWKVLRKVRAMRDAS